MQRVLVVEDTPAVLSLMERALSSAGYAVTRASSGADALQIAGSQAFDAIIVDYNIPRPNGLEVLAKVRELQPQCVRLLASGALDVSVTLEAINRGEVARVLSKPYDGYSLVEAVRDALAMQERMSTPQPSAESRNEVQALDECLAGDLLQLAVQPIVRADNGQLVAYEALLRSKHPLLNGPLPVISAAEKHQRLTQLGALVTERAAGWLDKIPAEIKLFVNLHPYELGDPEGLRKRIQPLCKAPSRVVFEITERSNLADVEHGRTSTTLLSDLGFAVAVDDLGSGFSALSLLAELKPNYIKIDMSIVRDIHKDDHKRRLVELICLFAAATSATVIGEGVEVEEEAAIMRTCGVNLFQGYLFGRPQLTLAG